MQRDSNKIAILVPNYFTTFQFDDALKALPNVGNVDVISSESGKIKSWDKTEKEYHTVVLYKNEIRLVSPLDYSTIIVHEDLFNEDSRYINKETISFINLFMGRMKPIVAACQKEWTIISGSGSNKVYEMIPAAKSFKISA
jgi:hypothetical protein